MKFHRELSRTYVEKCSLGKEHGEGKIGKVKQIASCRVRSSMARSVLVESHVLYGETSFWLSQLPGMSFDTFLRGMKLPYSVLLLRDLLVAERFKIEYCRRDTPCELQR